MVEIALKSEGVNEKAMMLDEITCQWCGKCSWSRIQACLKVERQSQNNRETHGEFWNSDPVAKVRNDTRAKCVHKRRSCFDRFGKATCTG